VNMYKQRHDHKTPHAAAPDGVRPKRYVFSRHFNALGDKLMSSRVDG